MATDSKYVHDNMGSKVREARHIKFINDVKAMWRYLNDQPTAAHIAVIVGALAYFICPVDAIPDLTPIVGYADDAVVIAAAVASLGSVLDRYRS